jgi:hypothetical protein
MMVIVCLSSIIFFFQEKTANEVQVFGLNSNRCPSGSFFSLSFPPEKGGAEMEKKRRKLVDSGYPSSVDSVPPCSQM